MKIKLQLNSGPDAPMYKNLLSRKMCKKDLIRHCNSKMIIITIPETSKLPISERQKIYVAFAHWKGKQKLKVSRSIFNDLESRMSIYAKTKRDKNSCRPNICLKDMSVIDINISVLCWGKSGSSKPKLLPEILLEHDTRWPDEGRGLSYLTSQNHTHHPGRAGDYRTF